MVDKRIIKAIPNQMHKVPVGAIGYDGNYDYITDESEDHNGALYASVKRPRFEEDQEGNRVKVSDETVLVSPDKSIWKRHTFADWEAVGKDVPPPEPE